jgi:hypothetical protein
VALTLPFARRDLDRLRLILAAQNRLREVHRSPRVKQMLTGRGYLEDALRWMEIHGGIQGQELAAHWRSLDTADVPPPAEPGVAFDLGAPAASVPAGNWDGEKRRRRRRRRRRRPAGSSTPATPA